VAADDVELGHVVDLTLGEPSGTELVAAASIGATTLTVDYAGEFEDAGEVVLNGEVLAYTSIDFGDTDTDPDIINLAAPLAAAAAVDDRVGRISGGEEVTDWLLHVSLGDGHPVDIPIPFEQRAMWSNVDTSTPPPVLVSADLERLVEVPGRPPQIDVGFVGSPLFQAHLPVDGGRAGGLSILDSTTTTVNDWDVAAAYDPSEFSFDAATGVLTLHRPGDYTGVVIDKWAASTIGRREATILSTTSGVDKEELNLVESPPNNGVVTQVIPFLLTTTEPDVQIRIQVWQNTGLALALRGNAAGTMTTWRIRRDR
jgi:hypothetical protein